MTFFSLFLFPRYFFSICNKSDFLNLFLRRVHAVYSRAANGTFSDGTCALLFSEPSNQLSRKRHGGSFIRPQSAPSSRHQLDPRLDEIAAKNKEFAYVYGTLFLPSVADN